jgi:hypothetical protein
MPVDHVPLRVFCDLEVNHSSEERQRAVDVLQNCDHVDMLRKKVPQTAIWRRYAEYPFVISAPGNGLDCHRTWELLYLGCIVITKTSPLDSLFDGLPVVIVKDWDEVADKRNLKKWLQQYCTLTGRETIWKRLEPENFIRPIRKTLGKL